MSASFLIKLGLLVAVAGPLLALYTGNLFGFSEKVRRKIKLLENKSDKRSQDDLLYCKINEWIRKSWPLVTVVGVVMIVIGFFIGV